MNGDDDNRRLLLAAALCLGILGLWGLFFPRPAPEPGPGGAEQGSQTTTATTGPAAPVATSTPTEAPTPTPVPVEPVEPEHVRLSGEVPVDKDTLRFVMTLTNVGGAIDGYVLPDFKERNDDNRATQESIQLANRVQGLAPDRARFRQMAGLEFLEGTTFSVDAMPVYEIVERADDAVTFRHRTKEGVVVEREWRLREGSFLVESAITVRNESGRTQTHRIGLGAALARPEALKRDGGFFSGFMPPADHLQALCYVDGSVKREGWSGLEDDSVTHDSGAQWVAADRQYFVSALVLRDGTSAGCGLEARGEVVRSQAKLPLVTLAPGEEQRHKFTAYLGVKKPDLMTLANADLEAAIDYTILGMNLAPLCTLLLWILRQFYTLTASWGLAIVGLTMLVKLVLFPLNQRQGKSMRAMTALRPEMDAIRAQYADDRQRQSEELLKLYRKHNVNPASGCLPILIQMPIWFALYRSLWVSVDLYQEGFLWIEDLTTRDPYWVLPLALTLVMFLQQRMLPTTMDPAQQKILQYFMPLMFGSMMAWLPAGLSFYILVNTVLTILQQHFINRSVGGPPGREPEGAPAEA
jgi:YidC/Oxa1 family membrane protein insertase